MLSQASLPTSLRGFKHFTLFCNLRWMKLVVDHLSVGVMAIFSVPANKTSIRDVRRQVEDWKWGQLPSKDI